MVQAPSCHMNNNAVGWHWEWNRAFCMTDQVPPSRCPGRSSQQAALSLPLLQSQMDLGLWGRAGGTTLFCATPIVDGLQVGNCWGCALCSYEDALCLASGPHWEE